jgi:hypothetical protein
LQAPYSLDTESVCTYPVFMNVTISVDDELLDRARELARQRGTSLQGLLREYLTSLVGREPPERVARELMDLMRTKGGHSGRRKFRREDAYQGRL